MAHFNNVFIIPTPALMDLTGVTNANDTSPQPQHEGPQHANRK